MRFGGFKKGTRVKMKPETIARRAEERKKAVAERHANLISRLRKKVEEEGPNSIYAEMLEAVEERRLR